MEELTLVGTAENIESDIDGPTIRIGFAGNDLFVDGGTVVGDPILKVVISDDSGINITGDTGHEIEMKIDDGESVKLTDYFNLTI